MSHLSEHEQPVSRQRAGIVPLSTMIEFMCQKVYTDMMHLVDLLPSKTDFEKKREIAMFLSRTRHLFIRLEALVKWANSASKVDKCEKISNFLEEQSFFLLGTANSLSRLLRETLVGARLPPFAVLLAVDVCTRKSYTRLPKCLKARFVLPEPITTRELSQCLLDLNRVIQHRLSMTQLPQQFRSVQIANGRVIFSVPNEFEVSLTLMSEALNFPWRILGIKFIVNNSELGQRATGFLQSQAQSRILYRQFDKRPPLIHLYDMLHSFSMSLQLDVLHEQARQARARRPDQLNIELYRPGHCLTISYWHGLSRAEFHTALSQTGRLYRCSYLLTFHIDPWNTQRPLCLSHQPELPVVETHRIGRQVQGDQISIENLLTRTLVMRAEQILNDLHRELAPICPGPIRLSDAPLCLYVPLLWPCHAQELLQVRIDPAEGLIHVCLIPSAFTEADPGTGEEHQMSFADLHTTLSSIESILNRPSIRRLFFGPAVTTDGQVTPNTVTGAAQQRSYRALAAQEQRLRSILITDLQKLRIFIGVRRLIYSASLHRAIWQPVQQQLPLLLSAPSQTDGLTSNNAPFSSTLAKLSAPPPPYRALLERLQLSRSSVVYIKVLPNNEHYLVAEVVPATGGLSVEYRYHLLVCAPVHSPIEVCVNADGLLLASVGPAPSGVIGLSDSAWTATQQTHASSATNGLFLRVTHCLALDPTSLWTRNPLLTLEQLQARTQLANQRLLHTRKRRLDEVLQSSLPYSSATNDKCNTSGPSEPKYARPSLWKCGGPGVQSGLQVWRNDAVLVPSLGQLLATLEERLWASHLAMQLSRVGIVHSGVQYDSKGCISCVEIVSFPQAGVPVWAARGAAALARHVRSIILRPHFDADRVVSRRLPVASTNSTAAPCSTNSTSASASGSTSSTGLVASLTTGQVQSGGAITPGSVPDCQQPCQRNWQLDVEFWGLPEVLALAGANEMLTLISDGKSARPHLKQSASYRLKHQTSEWPASRLEDLVRVVTHVQTEWASLSAMHTICAPVVQQQQRYLHRSRRQHQRQPDFILPSRSICVFSYDLKTLSLVYGPDLLYLAEVAYQAGHGLQLSLGTRGAGAATSVFPSPVPCQWSMDYSDSGGSSVVTAMLANTALMPGSSPHCLIRHHLEELVNSTRSIGLLARVLVQTLSFVCSLDALKDPVLSYHGLWTSAASATAGADASVSRVPVRGLVLLPLSCYDVLIVYRSSLALHVSLQCDRRSTVARQSHQRLHHNAAVDYATETSPTSDAVGESCSGGDRVLLTDAYRQLTDAEASAGGNTSISDAAVAFSNLAPLPAFGEFLRCATRPQDPVAATSGIPTVAVAVGNNHNDDSRTLSLTQLACLVHRSTSAPIAGGDQRQTLGGTSAFDQQLTTRVSLLEGYFATALLFHATLLAALTLVQTNAVHIIQQRPSKDTTAASPATAASGSVATSLPDTLNQVYANGSLVLFWPRSDLITRISMTTRPTSTSTAGGQSTAVARWCIRFAATASEHKYVDQPGVWCQETLTTLETFFESRVCVFPFQPSAVVSFFRMLALPSPLLRETCVRLMAWDLQSTPTIGGGSVDSNNLTGSTQRRPLIRLCLVGLGGTLSPTGDSEPGLISADGGGRPAISVQPPCLTLQLIVGGSSLARVNSAHPAPLTVGFGELGHPVGVVYNWETNTLLVPATAAAATMGCTSSAGQRFLSQVRANSAGLVTQAQQTATAKAGSALLELVLLLDKMAASGTAQ